MKFKTLKSLYSYEYKQIKNLSYNNIAKILKKYLNDLDKENDTEYNYYISESNGDKNKLIEFYLNELFENKKYFMLENKINSYIKSKTNKKINSKFVYEDLFKKDIYGVIIDNLDKIPFKGNVNIEQNCLDNYQEYYNSYIFDSDIVIYNSETLKSPTLLELIYHFYLLIYKMESDLKKYKQDIEFYEELRLKPFKKLFREDHITYVAMFINKDYEELKNKFF